MYFTCVLLAAPHCCVQLAPPSRCKVHVLHLLASDHLMFMAPSCSVHSSWFPHRSLESFFHIVSFLASGPYWILDCLFWICPLGLIFCFFCEFCLIFTHWTIFISALVAYICAHTPGLQCSLKLHLAVTCPKSVYVSAWTNTVPFHTKLQPKNSHTNIKNTKTFRHPTADTY